MILYKIHLLKKRILIINLIKILRKCKIMIINILLVFVIFLRVVIVVLDNNINLSCHYRIIKNKYYIVLVESNYNKKNRL
jgi:hypothetical protein